MKDLVMWIMGLTLAFWGMVACENSDWNKAKNAAEARQNAVEAKPHVIRESDGCKVYEWKDSGGVGTTHYFTKCGPLDTVTTERHYTESCGKNCRKDKSEIIVTQPKGPPA